MARYCYICKRKLGIFEKNYGTSEYDMLCKNCFDNEIHKAEKISKTAMEEEMLSKINEQRKQLMKEENKELYKKELLNKYSNLAYIYIELNNQTEKISSKINNIKVTNATLFVHITHIMYKYIGNSESLNKITQVIFNKNFLNDIVDSTFLKVDYNIPDLLIQYTMPEDTLEYNNEDESKDCNSCLNSMLSGDYNAIKMFIDFHTIENRTSDYYNIRRNFIHIILVILLYADIFMRAVILSRNINKFINNADLYKMYKNLRNKTNCTIDDITYKLFPIYNQYYTSSFQDKFDIITFNSLLKMVNNHEENKLKDTLNSTLYYKEINEYIKDGEPESFRILLENIDNKLYFNTFGFKNITTENNIAYTSLYHYMVKKAGEHIPTELFFQILVDKFGYINLLKLKDRKIEIEQEKERLLNGDFTKEKAQEIDKLNFNNINTGYDFENYLKNIFDELGYNSIVTKSSGDQGGDLIVEKADIKTVVQAKFYSNPVGNKAIQEVTAAIAFYNADVGMVVTNNMFTKAAIELAKANKIELIDGKKLDDIRNKIIKK